MSGVILSNLKKRRLYLKPFPEVHKRGRQTHTNTHTHDDSIRQNAMRHILPKNNGTIKFRNKIQRYYTTLKKSTKSTTIIYYLLYIFFSLYPK